MATEGSSSQSVSRQFPVRRTRSRSSEDDDDDESEDGGTVKPTASVTEVTSSGERSQMLLLVTRSHGNFTLDSRFCDRGGPGYGQCASSFDLALNLSLSVPISRYFNESRIVLSFPGTLQVSHCPTNQQQSRDMGCSEGGDSSVESVSMRRYAIFQ